MTLSASERRVGLVPGTPERQPGEQARLAAIESKILDGFDLAGYAPIHIPVLEFTELHERKSGAGIVSKLFEVGASGASGSACLRPELTAGIVRAYAALGESPPLPWRVRHAGPVFRHEAVRQGIAREFQQLGVELLGAGGPQADAEVLGLADWTLQRLGIADTTIRLGHVGLILELLDRSGLPAAVRAALVEMLSAAAAEGRNVQALETGLDQLAAGLGLAPNGEDDVPPVPIDASEPAGPTADARLDRLFRTLVPTVSGRRSGHEILHRLRRKWELGHDLRTALDRVRSRIHTLADWHGPALQVLEKLDREYAEDAPASIQALRELLGSLEAYGIGLDRVEVDLGYGRGIGFYSQMVFEFVVSTPDGPVEVCGGGRYDGLAHVLGAPADRDARGVGFAFGLERLGRALAARGLLGADEGGGLLIVPDRTEALEHAVRLARRLRDRGRRVVIETDRDPESAREQARATGCSRVVVVSGPAEHAGNLTELDPKAGSHHRPQPISLAALTASEASR